MSESESLRAQLVAIVAAPINHLTDDDAENRRIAVAACVDHPDAAPQLEELLRTDTEPVVRRECAETLGILNTGNPAPLEEALEDESADVREAVVTALGELSMATHAPPLATTALDGTEDNMVREAAVAALGAIGDPSALPALLQLVVDGPPQVRRRCVAALSVFDGEEVEHAIRQAARDRNPMVREAAEMLVGRGTDH